MDSNHSIIELTGRKDISHAYLRSLSPESKIAQLISLQERYFQMLTVREANGGRPIPEKWKKWNTARHPK